jgi:hypothetical protein
MKQGPEYQLGMQATVQNQNGGPLYYIHQSDRQGTIY